MEIIGIKINNIMDQIRLESEFKSIYYSKDYTDKNIFLADYFSKLKKIFVKENLFTKNSIKESLKNELSYRDEWGGTLVKMFLSNLKNCKVIHIHECLILELLQCVDYGKFLNDDELLELEIQLLRTCITSYMLRDITIPFYRILSKLYSRVSKQNGKWVVNGFDEVADCEIVHLSLIGGMLNGEFRQVRIVTTEKLCVWKDRVNTFFTFIEFANENIVPKINEFHKLTRNECLKLNPGRIYWVDPKSGEIDEKYLEISEVIDEFKNRSSKLSKSVKVKSK